MRSRGLLAPLVLIAVTGCVDYRWHFPGKPEEFERLERSACGQNKYLFIFYKDWLEEDSGRMHGEVLGNNQVGALFQDTVNILLCLTGGPVTDKDMARYMIKYGVTEPPACVIVAPDGSYQKRTGFIAKDRFIRFVEQAKSPPPGAGKGAKGATGPP